MSGHRFQTKREIFHSGCRFRQLTQIDSTSFSPPLFPATFKCRCALLDSKTHENKRHREPNKNLPFVPLPTEYARKWTGKWVQRRIKRWIFSFFFYVGEYQNTISCKFLGQIKRIVINADYHPSGSRFFRVVLCLVHAACTRVANEELDGSSPITRHETCMEIFRCCVSGLWFRTISLFFDHFRIWFEFLGRSTVSNCIQSNRELGIEWLWRMNKRWLLSLDYRVIKSRLLSSALLFF